MTRRSLPLALMFLGFGFVISPVFNALGLGGWAADCVCTGVGGTPNTPCPSCPTGGPITLRLGCKLCCESNGGTTVPKICSQQDGPGNSGLRDDRAHTPSQRQ